MTEFFDFAGDPFAGDAVQEYYHVQSGEYGGDYDDMTAPASPNFPVITPTRYFLSLPQVPYTEDFSTYPMTVKDVTSGVTLTRVTASPAANEYRVATAGSKAAQVIELHSGQAGHTIGFDYYGFGSVIDEAAANLDFKKHFVFSGNPSGVPNYEIKKAILTTTWNMYTSGGGTSSKSLQLWTLLSNDSPNQVLHAKIMIDTGEYAHNFDAIAGAGSSGDGIYWRFTTDSGNFTMYQKTSTPYNTEEFSSAIIYVILEYI